MIFFENVSKEFQGINVLDNITFTVGKGELLVLIGESGSGKTTLLKLINKLSLPTKGIIYVDGVNINEQNEITLRRNLGYVIQKTGLFPHMTVFENIRIIMKLENVKKIEIKRRVQEVMELVGLPYEQYHDRFPSELSGGQQQRVGIARALVTDPEVILMDEPFSALDPITRESLQNEVILLQEKTKKTIVFVTHDMKEALHIADRICFLDKGKILQLDTVERILKHPNSKQVETFFGKDRIWEYPEFIYAKDIMENDIIVQSEVHSEQVETYQVVAKNNGTYDVYQRYDNNEAKLIPSNQITLLDAHVSVKQILKNDEDKTVFVVTEDEVPIGIVTNKQILSVLKKKYIKEGNDDVY